MSNFDMPFGPRIPYDQMVPSVCPGHNEQAKSIVIVYVHTIVFYTGLYATTGFWPSG